MKATLEFNLPEERQEFIQAALADNMAIVLFEITRNLRKQCRGIITDPNFTGIDTYLGGVEAVFDKINELTEQYNINEILE